MSFMEKMYGISKATVSTYVRNLATCLYKVLQVNKSTCKKLQTRLKKRCKEGVANALTKFLTFENRTRIKIFRHFSREQNNDVIEDIIFRNVSTHCNERNICCCYQNLYDYYRVRQLPWPVK